jgi:hypothetical protein
MEIKKSISVTLTTEEVANILKDHFKTKSIQIDDVHFNVSTVYDKDDYGSRPSYQLVKVNCEGVEKQEREEYKPSHS